MPIEEFLYRHQRDMEHFMGCLGYNILACDMGALPHQYNDQKAIRLLISMKRLKIKWGHGSSKFKYWTFSVFLCLGKSDGFSDDHFDLVMIAERFEESLVLLSHLLCHGRTTISPRSTLTSTQEFIRLFNV